MKQKSYRFISYMRMLILKTKTAITVVFFKPQEIPILERGLRPHGLSLDR